MKLFLPCPFCGCKTIGLEKTKLGYKAICSKCVASIGRVRISDLVKAWNKRNEPS